MCRELSHARQTVLRNAHAFDCLPDGRREGGQEKPFPAIDCLTRGVILGTNTKLGTLTEDERRRHEAVLTRMAQKAALAQAAEGATRGG